MSGEVHTDKILSLKDWIDSFWHFQEEDLNFFKNLLTRGKLPNVEEILKTLKERYNIDIVIANGENASHGFGLTVKMLKSFLIVV